jgi:ACS family tartrate transporter-like MFS transporter
LGIGNHLGLHSWQWLFIIEGVPACLLALVVLKVLPDNPAGARWLNDEERKTIGRRIAVENPVEHRDIWRALTDIRVIAFGLVNFGILAGANGVALWLPLIVKDMGFSNLTTGFLVALPSLASVIVMIFWGRSSDARGERVWHVAIPALVGSASFMVASFAQVDAVMLVALAICQIMLWSAIAPLISLPSSFLGGSAAAGGIALVVSIGQIGSFTGSLAIGAIRDATGSYSAAMAVIGSILLIAAIIVLAVGRMMAPRSRTADANI